MHYLKKLLNDYNNSIKEDTHCSEHNKYLSDKNLEGEISNSYSNASKEEINATYDETTENNNIENLEIEKYKISK